MNNVQCSTGTQNLLEALLHLARNFNGPPQCYLPFSYKAPWHCLVPGNFKVKKKSSQVLNSSEHYTLTLQASFLQRFSPSLQSAEQACHFRRHKSTQIYAEVLEAIQHIPTTFIKSIPKKPVNLPWDRGNLRNLFNQENTLWKDTQSKKPTAEVCTTRHEKYRLPCIQVWVILSQTIKEAVSWLHGLSEQLIDLGQEITGRD